MFLDIFNTYLMLSDSSTYYWFEGLRVFIPVTFFNSITHCRIHEGFQSSTLKNVKSLAGPQRW